MTNVLITGASGGVGTILTMGLENMGFKVHGVDILEPSIPRSQFTQLDISDSTAVFNFAERIRLESYGAIIHCAANQPQTSILDPDSSHWQKSWNTNVLSLQQLVAQLASTLAMNKPHRVIVIGSVHSRQTSAGLAAYAASKAALESYVRSLAIETANSPIAAMFIRLGATEGPLLDQGLARFSDPVTARATLVSRLPSGEIVRRQDLLDLVSFLLSPAGKHLNGSSVPYEGGVEGLLASEVL